MPAEDYADHVGPTAFIKFESLRVPLSNIILPVPLTSIKVLPGEISTIIRRLHRYDSRLAVHILPDGQYQTVAGRCIADLHRLRNIQEAVEQGLVTTPEVRCMVLVPQQSGVCSHTHTCTHTCTRTLVFHGRRLPPVVRNALARCRPCANHAASTRMTSHARMPWLAVDMCSRAGYRELGVLASGV